jgi:hypothetical protein
LKPIDSNISPYLQQPLRTLEEVLQERARRQRQPAADTAKDAKNAVAESKSDAPAVSPKRIDQTI